MYFVFDLDKVIAFRIKKEGYLNYLYLNYHGDVDNDSIQKLNQVADYIGVSTNSATKFEPRNAIIHQLESSGMMRYFKDEEIYKALLDARALVLSRRYKKGKDIPEHMYQTICMLLCEDNFHDV